MAGCHMLATVLVFGCDDGGDDGTIVMTTANEVLIGLPVAEAVVVLLAGT